MKAKGLLKNKGFLVGVFVSVCLLVYFVGFSGIPFNMAGTTVCGSTVTSISNVEYNVNDSEWGDVWLATIRTGIGCDVIDATIEGSEFVYGSNIGEKSIHIYSNLKRQGCRGVIEKGIGGIQGQESLRKLKRLAVVDKSGVGSAMLELAEIETEALCSNALTAQGNEYVLPRHIYTQNFDFFGFPTTYDLTTECYGYDSTDLNLLGTVSSYDKFFNIDLHLTGEYDTGTFSLNESDNIKIFSTGKATVTDFGTGQESCNDVSPGLSPAILQEKAGLFGGVSEWKLINKFDLTSALDYRSGLAGCVALATSSQIILDSDAVLPCINNYNNSVDRVLSSTPDVVFGNQTPLGYLGDTTQFEIMKSDVVRPQIALKLNASWVGLKSFAGTPEVGDINVIEGKTSRNVAVAVDILNINENFSGSFLIENDCSGAVTPKSIIRGVEPNGLTSVVFENNFKTEGTHTCSIYVVDANGGGDDRKFYSVTVSVCNLIDDGNWRVNPDTCTLQCGLTEAGCGIGYKLDLVNCVCIADEVPFPPQDCALIPGSYFDPSVGTCVCPTDKRMTTDGFGNKSCQLINLEICPPGEKLNEAGDACIPKELNLLAVFGAILIVGGIVFIAWNFWFGRKKGKSVRFAKKVFSGR